MDTTDVEDVKTKTPGYRPKRDLQHCGVGGDIPAMAGHVPGRSKPGGSYGWCDEADGSSNGVPNSGLECWWLQGPVRQPIGTPSSASTPLASWQIFYSG